MLDKREKCYQFDGVVNLENGRGLTFDVFLELCAMSFNCGYLENVKDEGEGNKLTKV